MHHGPLHDDTHDPCASLLQEDASATVGRMRSTDIGPTGKPAAGMSVADKFADNREPGSLIAHRVDDDPDKLIGQ